MDRSRAALLAVVIAIAACTSSPAPGGASAAPLDRAKALAIAAKAPEAAEFAQANPGATSEVKKVENLQDLASKYPVIYGGLSGEVHQVDYKAGEAALLCVVQASPEQARCFRSVSVVLK